MKTRSNLYVLTSISALALLGAAATVAVAQKPASPGAAQQPVRPAEPAAARLLPEHSLLQKLVGTWEATVTTTKPGGQTAQSRGTLVARSVGDAWIASDFAGETNGAPLTGHGVDGYDTSRDRFVSVWVDAASTELLVFEGTHDEATKTTTMTCEGHDPRTGTQVKYRTTTVWKSPNARTYQLSTIGADGKDTELMRIEYTRRG